MFYRDSHLICEVVHFVLKFECSFPEVLHLVDIVSWLAYQRLRRQHSFYSDLHLPVTIAGGGFDTWVRARWKGVGLSVWLIPLTHSIILLFFLEPVEIFSLPFLALFHQPELPLPSWLHYEFSRFHLTPQWSAIIWGIFGACCRWIRPTTLGNKSRFRKRVTLFKRLHIPLHAIRELVHFRHALIPAERLKN